MGRPLGALPQRWALPVERLAPPGRPAALPRDSATVVLLREGVDGMEVFLLHRVAEMAFAGGMTVFLGGGLDLRDSQTALGWAGPDPVWWAARLGADEGLARALVCAAVRETFEEAGVLLAGPDAGSVVSDTAPYVTDRAALVAGERSLAEFLAAAGLVLRADLLAPWARWVTPEVERRRYDTRFFLAALPAGQRADGATTEARAAGWRRPVDALEDFGSGRWSLLPPTWVVLAELSRLDSVAAALRAAADREITPIRPRWCGTVTCCARYCPATRAGPPPVTRRDRPPRSSGL